MRGGNGDGGGGDDDDDWAGWLGWRMQATPSLAKAWGSGGPINLKRRRNKGKTRQRPGPHLRRAGGTPHLAGLAVTTRSGGTHT